MKGVFNKTEKTKIVKNFTVYKNHNDKKKFHQKVFETEILFFITKWLKSNKRGYFLMPKY
jgi:hypothetical protein